MSLTSIGIKGSAPFVVLMGDGGSFSLPLPDDMASSLPIDWDVAKFGVFANQAHGTGTLPDWDSIKETASQVKAGIPLIASKAGWSLVAGGQGGNIAESRAGAVLNANKEMLFKGVDFRKFTLTWTLMPMSASESKEIHSMIRTLQKSSVGSLSNDGRLRKYPSSWKIRFSGAQLSDIKDVGIQNTSVNYGTGGKVILHKDGYPVTTTLTISFTELTIMSDQDFPTYGG